MSSAISIIQSMRIARTERLDRIAFIRPPLVGQRPQDGASQSSAMKRLQPIGSRAHLLPESSHTPLYPSPATGGTAPWYLPGVYPKDRNSVVEGKIVSVRV